jgi:phosphohistidine phosphatase SixA
MHSAHARGTISVLIIAIFALCGSTGMTAAQTPPSNALTAALQKGGNVIVMRHASSPRDLPTTQTADPDNTSRERQLDQTGRDTAQAMGKAFRDLKIPVGEVFSSPTYRARETIKQAGFPEPRIVPELGDGGASMQATSDAAAAWLKKQVTQFPSGTNTLMVTHMPNITRAFPNESAGLADGEALIFAADGKGAAKLLARVKIEDWPTIAAKR